MNVTTETLASTESICPICYEEFCPGDGEGIKALPCQEADNSVGIEILSSGDYGTSDATILQDQDAGYIGRRRRFRVDGCGHQFCHECLAQHCMISISNRDIPVPCPQQQLHRQSSDHEKPNPTTNDLNSHWTGSTSTRTGRDQEHCLTPELVKAILLMMPPVKDDATKPKAFTAKCEDYATKHESNDDFSEESRRVIRINRTMSTQSISSASSHSVTSSSSALSLSSLQEYWTKYLRLQRLQADRSLVECPNCDNVFTQPSTNKDCRTVMDDGDIDCSIGGHKTIQQTLQDLESPSLTTHIVEPVIYRQPERLLASTVQALSYPQLECPSCHHRFCAIHGDSHAGLTCQEFAKTDRGQDLIQSEIAIREMTKRCSHDDCGVPIARIGGCAHIICANCHQDFCWNCGTHLYLTGKVIRSCQNCKQGFVDHRYYGQYRLRLLLILPLYLILSAIYITVVGAGAVLSFGFCCCFCCGTRGSVGGAAASTTSEPGPGGLKPRKGICMATRVFCFPLQELMRDCGFLSENNDDDVRS